VNEFQKQFLLEDFKQWSQSYLTNEELGDRRVNLFIVIAGGAIGWATVRELKEALPVLFGVVVLGLVTLLRVARRNRVSSGLVHALKVIRGKVLDDDLVKDLTAKLPASEARQVSFGGLSTLVLALNSMLLALGALRVWPDAKSPAVAVVVVAAVVQWLLVRRLEAEEVAK
jgi:hypothetical protein